MRKKKIALYGGSFDPIHNGHLHIACSAIENYHLDLVLFCPAAVSPHKQTTSPHASKHNRLEMLNQALAPFSYFALCDYEIRKEGPSYTVDTLEHLTSHYGELKEDIDLYLLVGEDCLPTMEKWKNIDAILSMAKLIVAPRRNFQLQPSPLQEYNGTAIPIVKLNTPYLDISSSWIRYRVKKDYPISYLVPRCVEDYICYHKLYL